MTTPTTTPTVQQRRAQLEALNCVLKDEQFNEEWTPLIKCPLSDLAAYLARELTEVPTTALEPTPQQPANEAPSQWVTDMDAMWRNFDARNEATSTTPHTVRITNDGKTTDDAARSLGVGRIKFFQWLRCEGFFTLDNLPHKHYLDNGAFRLARSGKRVIVTDKGMDMIKRRTRAQTNAHAI